MHIEDFEFSYEYLEDESRYMMDYSSGCNMLIDDIMDYMGAEELKIFDTIEECLNISDTKDSILQEYVSKYCLKDDKTYKVNINNELSRNSNFIYVLRSCGVIKAVSNYLDWLQKAIAQNN